MTLEQEFDALTVERVNEYVATAQEEHLSLEFKRLTTADLSSQPDKNNFATALSGFANSVGGIVIWGVTTRKHSSGKVDVAAGKAEIQDVTLAVGRLNEFTGVLVSPSVDGVRHRKLAASVNTGFVATIVPPSDVGPHMALAGVHAYYKRNGDRFLPMEHFEIADMFGRRRRPSLQLVVHEVSAGHSGNGFADVHIDLSLENVGRGSANAPYIDLQSVPGSPGVSIQRQGVSDASANLMQSLWLNPRHLFLGRADLVIHPGIRFVFARVTWRLETNVRDPAWRDVQILGRVAAEGAAMQDQTLTIPRGALARVLGYDAAYLFPSDKV